MTAAPGAAALLRAVCRLVSPATPLPAAAPFLTAAPLLTAATFLTTDPLLATPVAAIFGAETRAAAVFIPEKAN